MPAYSTVNHEGYTYEYLNTVFLLITDDNSLFSLFPLSAATDQTGGAELVVTLSVMHKLDKIYLGWIITISVLLLTKNSILFYSIPQSVFYPLSVTYPFIATYHFHLKCDKE